MFLPISGISKRCKWRGSIFRPLWHGSSCGSGISLLFMNCEILEIFFFFPPFEIAFMWYPFVQDLIRKSIWFLKINKRLLTFVVLLSPYFCTSLLLFFWCRYQLFLFLCYIIVGRFDIWLKRLGIWHCLDPWLCWLGIQIQGVCLYTGFITISLWGTVTCSPTIHYDSCSTCMLSICSLMRTYPFDCSGNLASYIVPAATVGAMGYCYMWWKARFWIPISRIKSLRLKFNFVIVFVALIAFTLFFHLLGLFLITQLTFLCAM